MGKYVFQCLCFICFENSMSLGTHNSLNVTNNRRDVFVFSFISENILYYSLFHMVL